MNDLKKVEQAYKKYFSQKVPYTNKWKEGMYERLEHRHTYYSQVVFKIGVSLAILIFLVLTSVKMVGVYQFNSEKSKIMQVLLSDNAYDFVIYRNMGSIIDNYVLQDDFTGLNEEEVFEKVKNSLTLYLFLIMENHRNDNAEGIDVQNSAVEEVTEAYLEYFNSYATNGII